LNLCELSPCVYEYRSYGRNWSSSYYKWIKYEIVINSERIHIRRCFICDIRQYTCMSGWSWDIWADCERPNRDESRRARDGGEGVRTVAVGMVDVWVTRTILGLDDGASGMSNAPVITSSCRVQPKRLSPLMALSKIRLTKDLPSSLCMLRNFNTSCASQAICLKSSI
jgi:hypothetical protein